MQTEPPDTPATDTLPAELQSAIPAALPLRTRRTLPREASQLIRLGAAGLLAVFLVGFLVWFSLDQERLANQRLAHQLKELQVEQTASQSQIAELQAEVQDLKERWFGTPALWQPPPIANTDIEFFEVAGRTQSELIDSLRSAQICSKYGGCKPDPAIPDGVAWGLASFRFVGSHYTCYSPRTTTPPLREYMVLPRWSPPADGTVKIPLVEKWNALAKVIYTHEAGHVAITTQNLAALSDQAHGLPSCQALFDFWDKPSTFDKLNSDQDAYHARLRDDCRPEIGCIPPGWLGWHG